MRKPYIFTPGPTEVRENVRLARAIEVTNPDIDESFYDFYKDTCEKISKIIHTNNDVYILSGEGILGLEAACASLTEPKDRVLIIDNGIFGEGFGDFVKIYGGVPVYFSSDRTKEICVEELREFLQKDNQFKYATVVHCDTPSGVLNDISKICPLLKEYGIITVVDSVAAMVGETLKVDEWKVDIALGGSQKAFSAPPGLTILSISEDAFKVMDNRKTPIVGFYCNLTIWREYYTKKWFPYTMPISDIMGLNIAVDNILDEGIEKVIERHRKIAYATRKSLEEYGLRLYIKQGYSNTVTVIEPPEQIEVRKIIGHLLEKYNVLLPGSFGYLNNKVIRIGHMGENAHIEKIVYILNVLDLALKDLGYVSKHSLVQLFNNYYN
ncbi:pyridoxal-phosphate-dependent aminotransferase family protein [Clostridium sp. UBA4548]|uniref:pyridoxal-phosphate-dependent aminotransferase family protein n=1 Tax=Clostridium sp. UBA4548 TaxID=1946361 RepID=UPI0025C1C4EF|nr:alanine--glyoxylate aminotransferase family protein [Clostridium sp. UBA4548]